MPESANPTAPEPARIAYVVMHAPARGARALMVDRWRLALGDRLAGVEEDTHWSGNLPTARRAWRQLVDADCDWGHVLHEDMLACRDFLNAHAHVVACAPPEAELVSISTGRSTPAPWSTSSYAFKGGAVSIRRDAIADLLAWLDRYIPPGDKQLGDDSATGLWLRLTGRTGYIARPQLLGHDGVAKSVLGHNSPIIRGRTVADWLEDRDWRDFDWTPPEKLPKTAAAESGLMKRWATAIEGRLA